jgi:hypothetical protein
MARKLWQFPKFFVDPSNVSGLANDLNSGFTATTPIRTTLELNSRLFERNIQGTCLITYMSDDNGTVSLDLSTVAVGIDGAASLTFQGTRQILHTGGTFNAGTITINPLAPGGGQRQTAHTTDIANFAPFVFPSAQAGGTATFPARINDLATGSGAWIASGVASATASVTRPISNADGVTPGALTISDNYTITRPSILQLAGVPPFTSGAAGGTLTFNDFVFPIGSVGPRDQGAFSASITFYTRCAFLGPVFYGGTYNDCAWMSGTQGNYIANVNAGIWVPNLQTDQTVGVINVFSDTYVTGINGSLTIGQAFVENIFIASGIQVHDITGPGIVVLQGATALINSIVWGNGNSYGMQIGAGASIIVPHTPANLLPSITGTLGDFAFQNVGATGVVTTAATWDDATVTPTAHPQVTSWANFSNPAIYNLQAHLLSTGASIIAD